MALALFDLDNTLIAGDCAQAFSEFLAASEIPTPDDFIEVNHRFMAEYDAGQLNLADYMRYTLAPIEHLEEQQIEAVVQRFLDQTLENMILPKADALLEAHRQAGDQLVVVSASGTLLVQPIATILNIPHVLAVDMETSHGKLTGRIAGIPTFREGKVTRVQQWAEQHQQDLQGAAFYSDSINDLPLLEAVDRPVAVDPCSQLEQVARQNDWEILSLR